jgi:hypothetical protein
MSILLYKRFINMSSPTNCSVDHDAIQQTVKATVEKALADHSFVQVTAALPMWAKENYRGVYDEIPLHSADQFFDRGSHFELKQHYPMADSSNISLYEQNNHLYLSIKKDKGNIHYAVHKQIPLPPYAKRRGITSYFHNGTLVINVPK